MGDGECQTQACVLINGAAPVLAAHPTNWSKTCKTSDTIFYITVQLFFLAVVGHFQHTYTVFS